MLDMITDTVTFDDDYQEPVILEEDTMKDMYLTFLLEEQYFAISIKYVSDIIQVMPITRVPNCPPYVMGITNLRGKVIPIMDLRMRFEKSFKEHDDRTCIVVVEKKGVGVGLLVDSVDEVVSIPGSSISPPPAFHQAADVRFIQAIGMTDKGVRLILDCGMVLGGNPDSKDHSTED